MPQNGAARLSRMLLKAGLVTEGQLSQGDAGQAGTALELARTLIGNGTLSQDALTGFLAQYCRVPYASILDEIVKANPRDILPAELCIGQQVLPVSISETDLTVAMVNPTDANALQRVREHCPDRTIRPVACDAEQFTTVAKRFFAADPAAQKAIDTIEKQSSETAEAFIARVLEDVEEEQRLEFIEQQAMNTLSAMADRMRIFQGVPPLDVGSLLSGGMIEEFDAGRSIFQKGSGGGELYVVLSGRVAIKDGGHLLATMGPGDVFGELAFLGNTTRTASAVAEEQSAVLSLGEDEFQEMIDGEWGSRILLNLFGLMTERLARMNARIRELESN